MSKKRNYSDESYLGIYLKITLGGKPLSDFEHSIIEEVIFEDNSTGSDMVSITIHDPDYLLIGDKRLIKSTSCKVEGGYKTKHRTWIDGYVSVVDAEFPEEGAPILTIHVMDKSYLMNKQEKRRVFKNMTYKDIAGKIAKEHGLSFSGDSTGDGGKKQESVSQSYETDIQFLNNFADEIGYLVYVSGSKLYFKNKDSFSKLKATKTLWYRRNPFDILSFSPRIVEADQKSSTEASDVNSKTKKTTKAKSSKKK